MWREVNRCRVSAQEREQKPRLLVGLVIGAAGRRVPALFACGALFLFLSFAAVGVRVFLWPFAVLVDVCLTSRGCFNVLRLLQLVHGGSVVVCVLTQGVVVAFRPSKHIPKLGAWLPLALRAAFLQGVEGRDFVNCNTPIPPFDTHRYTLGFRWRGPRTLYRTGSWHDAFFAWLV
jgi:hypothetical protein